MNKGKLKMHYRVELPQGKNFVGFELSAAIFLTIEARPWFDVHRLALDSIGSTVGAQLIRLTRNKLRKYEF